MEELSRRVESAPTAGKRRNLAVRLAWATLVPGAAYDHGLPASRISELQAWAHRPGMEEDYAAIGLPPPSA